MVRVLLTDGSSALTGELPADQAMARVQAFLRAQQDEDPDPFGILSCTPDQLDVLGSEETLFTCVFHNPTRENHRQAMLLIEKLRQAGKAEEVAEDLEEFRGGPYDDGSQRFNRAVLFLQQKLRTVN